MLRGDKPRYADLMVHYDAAKLEMAQIDRKAAEGWRFRHHKGAASRILSAAWAGLKGLARRALPVDRPAMAPTRKRLSY